MYGKQYRLRAGRTKGIEAANRPIPAPLMIQAAQIPLFLHFLEAGLSGPDDILLGYNRKNGTGSIR